MRRPRGRGPRRRGGDGRRDARARRDRLGPAPGPDHARDRDRRPRPREFDFDDLALLEAGANAILQLPPARTGTTASTGSSTSRCAETTRFAVHLAVAGRAAQRRDASRARPEPERPRACCSSAASRSASATTCASPFDDAARATASVEGTGTVRPPAPPTVRRGAHARRRGRARSDQALRRDRPARRRHSRPGLYNAGCPRRRISRAASVLQETPDDPDLAHRRHRAAPEPSSACASWPTTSGGAGRPRANRLFSWIDPEPLAPLPQPGAAADQRRAAAVDAAARGPGVRASSTRT